MNIILLIILYISYILYRYQYNTRFILKVLFFGGFFCGETGWKKVKALAKENICSSGKDGSIGRNPLLPHTTKRRITTNLKSINNQKCQKITLHGTPTSTELKKQSNRTTRLVRQWRERTCGEAADHGAGLT